MFLGPASDMDQIAAAVRKIRANAEAIAGCDGTSLIGPWPSRVLRDRPGIDRFLTEQPGRHAESRLVTPLSIHRIAKEPRAVGRDNTRPPYRVYDRIRPSDAKFGHSRTPRHVLAHLQGWNTEHTLTWRCPMNATRISFPTRLATVAVFLVVLSCALNPCFAQAPGDTKGEVVCQVPGQSTIKFLVPAGTVVQQGQLVCELDSSALKAELDAQQRVVRSPRPHSRPLARPDRWLNLL